MSLVDVVRFVVVSPVGSEDCVMKAGGEISVATAARPITADRPSNGLARHNDGHHSLLAQSSPTRLAHDSAISAAGPPTVSFGRHTN